MSVLQPMIVNSAGDLLCPSCGEAAVHVDVVRVAARREDQPPYMITVHAVAGLVNELPAYGEQRSERRHWIELEVDCEHCPGGTVVLAQRRSATGVSFIPAQAQIDADS